MDSDFAEEYDWIPFASIESDLGPKEGIRKGVPYLRTHATNGSLATLRGLLEFFDDEELFACFATYSCAFQLRQTLPAYWRGLHNVSFLEYVDRICCKRLGGAASGLWTHSSRRIFPDKFFSPLLLTTTSWLTERQLVLFAALNMEYYLRNWVVIRYWYGMPFGEYMRRRFLQCCRKDRFAFFGNGNSRQHL